MGKMFEKSILFLNYIVNWNGRVMSFMELSELYRKVCVQPVDYSITQKWSRQVAMGEGKELVCLPNIKDQNWQGNKKSINRKVYRFHLRPRMLTTVPYRLQNSWEEIFDVLILWYMVY